MQNIIQIIKNLTQRRSGRRVTAILIPLRSLRLCVRCSMIVFSIALRATPLGYCFKSLIGHRNLLQQSLGQLRVELMSTPIGHNVTDHFAAGKSQVANHIQ